MQRYILSMNWPNLFDDFCPLVEKKQEILYGISCFNGVLTLFQRSLCRLFLLQVSFDDEPDNSGDDQRQDNQFDVLRILADLVVQLILWDDGMQIPS